LKNGWGRIFFTAAIAGLFKELEDVNKPLKTSINREDRFLYDLDQYIQDHISESLSVRIIAGNFGKSSNYFSDRVRKLSGESLGNHVRKLKMRRAMILLKKTDMKVYEIAQSLGYSDSYSFSKAFKVFQGESPVSFKRENG
jgi:AraC family transcriptional regulator of arabinose operon